MPMPSSTRLLNAVDNLVADFTVRFVAPPDQHIGVVEDVLGQAVIRFIECRRARS